MVVKFIYIFLFSIFILSLKSQPQADLKLNAKDTATVNALILGGKKLIIKGNYVRADSFNNAALKLAKAIHYPRGIFNSYNQCGISFWYRANFPVALQYQFTALKVAEQINDSFLMSRSQANIALVFIGQKEYAKALVYYTKALKFREKMPDDAGVSGMLNNIGTIYEKQNDSTMAMKYYCASLKVARKNNDFGMIGLSLSSIASIDVWYGKKDSAVKNYIEAIKIGEKIGDKVLTIGTKIKLASIYIEQKKYPTAEVLLKNALEVADSIGDLNNKKEANKKLSELYASIGNWKLSYLNHLSYTVLKDSIYNENKTKDMVKDEMNFDFDKKQAIERKEQEKKDAVSAEELKQKRMQRNFLILGFGLMLIVTGIVYRSYRQKQKDNTIIANQKIEVEKQKEIVDLQKQILETHQKDIIDSITYAKRLQEAILPPKDFIDTYIPHNFIYYKPKDLVAGDFYWAEKINDLFFIAVADSTGHGVPGCMVSLVCSNALNRSIKEFNITDPGKILDKTRELVVETFEKSADEVKDGMDISLLCIDRKNNLVRWSGANNPLWYISAADETSGIIEIKADKQPIGKTDNPKPFTTHTINYIANSSFYLFTDGFADQFGGPKGKKFKHKQFATLLLENHSLPLTEQKIKIDIVFFDWKNELEQVDDVCLIGIRL